MWKETKGSEMGKDLAEETGEKRLWHHIIKVC